MLQKRLGRNRLQRPPRQTGEHLLQASPGRQEEEREHRLSSRPFLKWGCAAPALPGGEGVIAFNLKEALEQVRLLREAVQLRADLDSCTYI